MVALRAGLFVGEGYGRPEQAPTPNTHMYDLQLACLKPALAAAGIDLVEVWWRAADADWRGLDAALALSAWDYQDHATAFLAELRRLEGEGKTVLNAPGMIAWNIRKTYLRDLEARGAPVIPTLWLEAPAATDIRKAFDVFGCGDVVLKRQVGAGAHGQMRIRAGEALPEGPLLDRPGMIQPFLPSVAGEGEFSFLFVDNAFSHAVIKRAQPGDYRIQPRYGGASLRIEPARKDLSAAEAVLARLDLLFPGVVPLYARVDMARGADGGLKLMELELIEPYLFVEEGPEIGAMFARGLKRRLAG